MYRKGSQVGRLVQHRASLVEQTGRFGLQGPPTNITRFHLKTTPTLLSRPPPRFSLDHPRDTMNRPRNKQPRSQGQRTNNNNNNSHGRYSNNRSGGRNAPRPSYGTVPTIQQVIPGANVSIVLKEDQPTGNETPGTVQDVLTKGNHPRGIKVRLRDGQVGRVQRMRGDAAPPPAAAAPTATAASTGPKFTHRYTDVRNDDFLSEPPPRSLADFFPDEPAPTPPAPLDAESSTTATARCPICEAFEGDEVAVSHHVEREHLG